MIFLKPHEYLPAVEAIFETLKNRILRVFPQAEVEHIGSSAIKEAISKGDLDILVRVAKSDFAKALAAIQALGFFVKEDTLRTSSLCMLETKEFKTDVAIQLIEAGSELENFILFRDRMNADATLVKSYNEMKMQSAQLTPEQYRSEKSEFIKLVLAKG